MPIELVCEVCGKNFTVPPSRKEAAEMGVIVREYDFFGMIVGGGRHEDNVICMDDESTAGR